MDIVMVVRHQVLVQKLSMRSVAQALGISRNTVRRYVDGAPVGVRKASSRRRPALERAEARMEALLGDSPRWTAGKQRLTATQLHRLLRAEGICVGVTTVKGYVREWKRKRAEVFVPLEYRPGDLALVDFFEVYVDIIGKRCKAFMFVMRLMASGRDFAWLFPRQDQTCFLEGHVRAFAHFGGTPHRLGYDNLKAAVKRLAGAERELTARFAALSNHYLFEASFARPYTGHDKGGVEARGKGIRLRQLVPIPQGAGFGDISAALLARLDAEARDTRDREGRSVMDRFAEEQTLLLPLPPTAFNAAATKHVSVSRRSVAQVDGAYYSVPCEWAQLQLVAEAGVDDVVLRGPAGQTVRHPRKPFGGRSIDYRHYLPELARKPQALRQVADSLVTSLGPVYVRAWQKLVDDIGPKQAARAFAQVLKATVEQGEVVVAATLELALGSGEPLQLALRPKVATKPLVELPQALRDIDVATASAADFDALLRGAA